MKRTLLPVLIAACWFSTTPLADDMRNMKGMDHGMPHMTVESSPNAQSKEYDHQFIDTMIQHHTMAMHMAQTAEPKATHTELKNKIQIMMEEQKKEMDELQQLKQQLYGDKGEAVNLKFPGMKPMNHQQMKELSAVEGEKFDMKFVSMMTLHHKQGITMAQSEINKGKQSEVKALAKKISQSQQKDIADMAKMKKQWNQK